MGKGKGQPHVWTAWVRPGAILAEWDSKPVLAKNIYHSLKIKLPIPIDLIHAKRSI